MVWEGREGRRGQKGKGEGRGARTKKQRKQGGAVYLDRTRAAPSLAVFHENGDEAQWEKTAPIWYKYMSKGGEMIAASEETQAEERGEEEEWWQGTYRVTWREWSCCCEIVAWRITNDPVFHLTQWQHWNSSHDSSDVQSKKKKGME